MDTQGTKHKNSNQDLCGLSLSPIDEVDESFGSTMSEEQRQEQTEYLQDETHVFTEMDPLKGKSEIDNRSDRAIYDRPCSIQLPVTPPEVLRKRICNLQSQNQYLSNELDQLTEFTQLEKQVNHSECISKDLIRARDDEFVSVNEKVQHLMKENLDLKNKLEQKDADFKELKEKLTTFSYQKCEIEKRITQIVQKLREKLQDDTSEIIKNNPCLEWLLRNKDFEKSEVDLLPHPVYFSTNYLEGFKDLFEVLITEKNNSKIELEALYLYKEELNQDNKQHVNKLELDLSTSEKEINQVKEEFLLVVEERNELSKAFSASKNELEASKDFLEEANRRINQLENEMERLNGVVTIDSIQEEFKLFLNELEHCLDSWQVNNSFNDIFVSLQQNRKLHHFFDMLTNFNTHTILLKVQDKLYNRVNLFLKEINQLRSVKEKLDDHLKNCESETNHLKIKALEYQNRESQKIIELKDSLNTAQCEKAHLKEKIKLMKSKTKDQLKSLSMLEYDLKETVDVLEIAKVEKIKLQKEIANFRNLAIKDEFQEVLSLILNELENIINSWNHKKRFKYVSDNLEKNDEFPCVKNKKIQNSVVHLFDKLKMKLNIHNDEFDQLHTTLKALKKQIEQYECDSTGFKVEFKVLDHQVKNELSSRISRLESLYNISEKEKVQLCAKLSAMDNESKQLTKTLHIAELKLKESEYLLEKTNNKKCKLQNEIENVAEDRVHQAVNSILQELENILDSCSSSENFKEIFDIPQKNSTLLPVIGSQNQTMFSNVLDKLKMKLPIYNKEYEQMCKRVQELNASIKHLEDQNLLLKNTVKDFESVPNMHVRDASIRNDSRDCSEELKTLREMMANEVTCLGYDENKDTLMGYSSVEMFSKLMQNIIKKEGEITSDFQKYFKTDLEKKEKIIENLNNKLKSQESWIMELEIDNDKMSKDIALFQEKGIKLDCNIKTLLNDLKSSAAEISGLKSKILEITTENDLLCSEINVLKESGKDKKDNLRALNEEVVRKNDKLASLEFKLSCMVSKEDIEILGEGKSVDNSKGDFRSKQDILQEFFISNYPSVSKANQASISSKENGTRMKPSNLIENSTELKSCIVHELEKEQTLLKDVFMPFVCDVDFGDQLFRFSDELLVLKELLQILANKIIEMEASHANSLHQLESTVYSKTKEINEFKLSIYKLYKEFEFDNKNLKSDSIISFINEHVYDSDVMSLRNELDLIKMECVEITNKSKEFEVSSKTGLYLIQNLKEVFEVFKTESLNKSEIIRDLYKTIDTEQNKSELQKKELNTLATQKSSLIFENNRLNDQLNDVKSQVLDIEHVIYKSDIYIPEKFNDTCGKIRYISDTFKENEENLKFFILQFYLMSVYIKTVENERDSAEKQKELLDKKSCLLKEQIVNSSKHFEETNIFVNKLVTKLPFKVSSLDKALETINQIFTEYNSLKEIQVGSLQERKLSQEKLSQQRQELRSVIQLNSSLKMELAKCEDCIRNLRSELRNGRWQRHSRENSHGGNHLLENKETTEAGSQTESVCCENLQKEVLEQKELSDVKSCKITSLELKIKKEEYPYKKKVCELEQALSQAKERIKTLRHEVTEQKTYIRDLIEAYQPQIL